MSEFFPTFRRILQAAKSPRPPQWPKWRRAVRTDEAIELLQLLQVATKHQLQLPPLMSAFAEDHRGSQRARLQALADNLSRGLSLSDALEQTPNVLPEATMLSLRFGRQMGATGPAIDSELRQLDATSQSRAWHPRIWIYWLLLLAYFLMIGSFVMVKIMPTFEAIVEDFEMQPPVPFVVFEAFCEFVIQWWWVGPLTIGVVGWLVLSGRLQRSFERGWLCHLMPVQSGWRSAEVLQNLGIAAEAGRPVPSAISTLARYHFDPTIRGQLLFVRNEVEQGADAWQSMHETDLITDRDVRACDAASIAGNLAWVLDLLSRRHRQQSSGWTRLLVDIVHPCVVLGFGAVGLMFAAAVFATLASMIQFLAR